MRHVFIVNPVAGKGKSLQFISEIKNLFAKSDTSHIIEITKYPGHATEIARKHVSEGKCRLYSVGGDGTLNEIVNGMVGSDSSLAIIPCGSGNDFIKSITDNLNIKNILEKSVHGGEKLIDLAKVGSQYFLNISSIGFDAEVLLNVNKIKKLPFITGRMAYILGVITTIFKYSHNFLKISIDEQHMEAKSLLIAVANGRYYGGGMLAAPEAQIDDGLFDICLIRNMSKVKILKFFPKFIKGQHGKIAGVSFYRGKRVEIVCDGEVAMNIDGEVAKTSRTVFEIIQNGIKIVIPQ